MIDALIKETLEKCKVPFGRGYVKDSPNLYMIYEFITSIPITHADDDNLMTEHTLRVHIYSKNDYAKLLSMLMNHLKSAGFRIASVDSEMFESDTGFYHRPVTFYYLEEE